MKTPVLVSIVTYQDAGYLENCLHSVVGQSCPTRIKVLDNDSGDHCPDVAARFPVQFRRAPTNLGFSTGHNQNLAGEDFEWALLLNADVILEEDFLALLLASVAGLDRVGTTSGKLLRMDSQGQLLQQGSHPILDSTGIYFTPSLRHFDRGSGQPDRGQYERTEFVFGVTGAALLVSRACYEDLSVGDEFLDEDFFIYREDADLAWRAQLRGWSSVYVPRARARHVRQVTPERRRQLAAAINRHSLKNRFLMRRKNIDWAVRLRCAPFMWLRDLVIVAYVLLLERSSIPAFRFLWQARGRTNRKRDQIQKSRKCSPRALAWWFSFTPRSRPAIIAIREDGKHESHPSTPGP